MKHTKKRCMLLFLVLLPSGWWIYSKYVFSMLKEDNCDKQKELEDYIRSKTKTISNNIEENEIYPIDIRVFPISTRRKLKVGSLQKYEFDQLYGEKPRERTKGKKIEEDKGINIEKISNYIDGNETYPIDISHFPTSVRIEDENEVRQAYKDGGAYKDLIKLKEMLQAGNETSRGIKFEDDFLRSYIISNDYEIDKAFSKIQNFLNLKIDHDYFFHNMSFDFTQNPEYRFITILPHKRKDGSVTVLLELAKWDPDKVPLKHLKQIMFIVYMQALRNPVTQANGINMINDFADIGFRYVQIFSPQNLYLLYHMLFEVIPAKYVGYHIVNINAIGRILVAMMRPSLPKYIENIFYTHSSVKELLDFFPPSMLPVQFGGNLTEYYAADWIRKANQQHGHFPARGQKNIFNMEFTNI